MNQYDRPKLRAMTFATGLATVVVGILLVTVPAVVKYGGEWILAFLMIAGAVTTGGFSVTALRPDVRIYTLLLAALSLVTAVIILVHPLDTFITLTTLMGFYFMVESGLMGGLGMSVRPNWTAASWMFGYAIVSFIMSALIWLRLAGAPKRVLVVMLAISFILRGTMYIALARLIKGRAPLRPAAAETPQVMGPSQS